MQIPIFNYNWSITAFEAGEIWQEFRFEEASPIDYEDVRDFNKESIFKKPNWLKSNKSGE